MMLKLLPLHGQQRVPFGLSKLANHLEIHSLVNQVLRMQLGASTEFAGVGIAFYGIHIL